MQMPTQSMRFSFFRRFRAGTRYTAATLLLLVGAAACSQAPVRLPVILDTDIGTDIDDAYALALLLEREDLDLIGVTTVSGDTTARARLAAKLLAQAGGRFSSVPVYAGPPGAPQYVKQVEWAAQFTSSAIHTQGAVEFMRRQIDARPGAITLIAIGELTNIAALLARSPDIRRNIRAIVLMGGAVRRGYDPDSPPEPEWNIKSNIDAARAVFSSGVPLLIAPLDATVDLRLTPQMRLQIFARGADLTDALASLDYLWTHTNTWDADIPTLFDVLAVQLVGAQPCPLTSLHVQIDDAGLTRVVPEATPNAQVALDCDAQKVLAGVVDELSE